MNATPLYPTYTATQFLYADVFDLAAAVNMLVNALVHQAVTRPRSLSFGVKGAMDRGHAALTADPATQSASLPYAAAKLHLSVGKLMGHGLDAVTDDVQAAYIQLGQLRRDRVSTAPQRQDGGA